MKNTAGEAKRRGRKAPMSGSVFQELPQFGIK